MKHIVTCILPLLIALGCSPSGDTKAAEKSTPPPAAKSTPTPAAKPTPPPAAKPNPAPATAPAKDADNTAKNAQDKDKVTPTDQSNKESDLALTTALRKAVVAMPEASVNAQNIKIVTVDGVITLRGPVASLEEKNSIEAAAKALPGVVRIDNQLEVETK